MNTNIFFNYKALLMAVLMLALNTSQVLAEAGSDHRGGNGGLGLASEFSMIAKNVEIIWEDICSNSGEKVNYCDYLTDYKSLLNKNSDRFVTVLSKPDVVGYDGQPREASNNGIDQIVLNSRLWDQAKMARLVVHELASILYLDSSDYYGFTNELLSLFSRKKYDLNIITAKEILPNRCSVNFAGKDASTIAKYISPELSQSN